MKKRLFVLVLALVLVGVLAACGCDHEWNAANCTDPKNCALCNETQGEALGHKWVDATCDAPKKCSVCHLTEGKELGHNWVDATTEAPKTCTNCAATEGNRIITDPRFTTESTKDFYGKWAYEIDLTGKMLGLEGYIDSVPVVIYYAFANDGTAIITIELEDPTAFEADLKVASRKLMLEILAEQGIAESQADDVIKSMYNVTLDEYIDLQLEALDMEDYINEFEFTGVYYVGQNGIYTAEDWDEEFTCDKYTLEGDTLTIELEEPLYEEIETMVMKKVK